MKLERLILVECSNGIEWGSGIMFNYRLRYTAESLIAAVAKDLEVARPGISTPTVEIMTEKELMALL